jgi:hypothetical protein
MLARRCAVVTYSNMPQAELLIDDRYELAPDTFVEMVVWRVPQSLTGSHHLFKYSLALVIDGVW